MRATARRAGVAIGLALAALAATACSPPAPLAIGDIERPPGVDSYEGAKEPTVDLLLSQVIETLPDGTDLDYEVLYTTGTTTDVNRWYSGAASRAGTTAPPPSFSSSCSPPRADTRPAPPTCHPGSHRRRPR